MEKKHGPWTIKKSSQLYKDDFVEFIVDDVIRPDGKDGTHSNVNVKPGIAVVALDNDMNLYLTKQFRYAIGRQSIEVICGAIEQGESALEAAKKELREEAGIIAEDWKDLGVIDIDSSIINSTNNLFLARNLSFTEKDQEGSEDIKITKYGLGHVVDMVISGEITHAPSSLAILKANEFLRSSTPKIK